MKYKIILESSIMQKGLPATAGSEMLENFIAPVDATVVERLLAAGVEIAGRADTSEFGVSWLFDGDLENPLTEAVKGAADAALCNDYSGAISSTATQAGLYYFHPSYGTVSRYGLIPSVCSMDQIGVLCKEPEVGFKVLDIISGYDSKDGVMFPYEPDKNKAQELSPFFEVDVADIPSDFSGVYKQVMQILCSAELSNNINRYDGIKFGHRAKEYNGLNELYLKSRTEAFGEDVKLAAIIGAAVLYGDNYERYYDKAMRIRRQIKESLDFDKYDVIISKSPLLSRLCGLPATSTPGYTYTADTGREDILRAVSKSVKGGAL